ncbi:DNA-binding transcriptional response regulator, NtrC family, contains REC, AAA-type ATPase, and a Fis-type DNA-binding domains [Syntrophus gentianae]|uniref:DNA-binding transcriptional response regulator, NtrC family, contains REC, AAA-type ATPase, and a Fis-type DNA-binding domains n=1 Tax=Syntrophus gentianae TaxID=43775 RepID=A0A1H7WYP5_9BACT|nr:sigma-54 dependent transcriptional regulator [Syntrophus gentianae]SEM26690.1 DNA-binding transcriptional response regulator, NtrC family, contains REC, AAA-type ATPase, and a Fis-type DNA-binding domains [Syntrophus gentianae]
MKKQKILIAEDDDLNRNNLTELLSLEGYEVHAVENGKEAMASFVEDKYDLVITDLKMPQGDGLELLKFVKDMNPDNIVIMMTGFGTVDSAVEAMKFGAFDYISKPMKDDLVKLTVSRALSFASLQEENVTLRDNLREKYDFGKMLGYSECMKTIFDTIEKVAKSDSTVIIYGESGTGKELVARAIHFNSDRKNFPLIPVNCGAIPEELLESELFGHEKGAFTGAIRNRLGRFELAQGGTIFLNEIGDMSPSLQVKLLRVIQEKQFERIGGVKTINADVRILAATNQNLEEAVAEKRFREDLYYRINVIPIHLPALRERGPDIAILANHFLQKFAQMKKKEVTHISPEAIACLLHYPWPGNVRELENLIEMLVVLKEGNDIVLEDLPLKIRQFKREAQTIGAIQIPEEGIDFNELVSQFEKDILLNALEKSGGVKNRAAKLLNLNRTTLVEKLKRLNISAEA